MEVGCGASWVGLIKPFLECWHGLCCSGVSSQKQLFRPMTIHPIVVPGPVTSESEMRHAAGPGKNGHYTYYLPLKSTAAAPGTNFPSLRALDPLSVTTLLLRNEHCPKMREKLQNNRGLIPLMHSKLTAQALGFFAYAWEPHDPGFELLMVSSKKLIQGDAPHVQALCAYWLVEIAVLEDLMKNEVASWKAEKYEMSIRETAPRKLNSRVLLLGLQSAVESWVAPDVCSCSFPPCMLLRLEHEQSRLESRQSYLLQQQEEVKQSLSRASKKLKALPADA